MNKQDRNKRSSYKHISQSIRQEIIDRTIRNGESIKQVAQELNVNVSTCKAILDVFEREGRIGKKEKRNKVFNVIQTFSFFCLNDSNIEQIEPIKIQTIKIGLQRNEDHDEVLKQDAKLKAEGMMKKYIDARQKSSQLLIERQLLQRRLFQPNYFQYLPANYNLLLQFPAIPPQQPLSQLPAVSPPVATERYSQISLPVIKKEEHY